MAFDVPILFIIFTRPDTAKLAMEEIRKLKPSKLLVFCDGPRPGKPNDISKIEASKAVIETIDWDCDLKLNYQTDNFGCGIGPKMAIDWLFSTYDKGIILEDDCIASSSFFDFCKEMLNRYERNQNIMHISGVNFLNSDQSNCTHDYYFSKHQHCWGWATWKRAWERFDYKMTDYPEFLRKNGFSYLSRKKQIRNYWKAMMDEVFYPESTDIWDYQWSYAIWKNKALCITPATNLISNIGFGPDATHTQWEPDVMNNMPRFDLKFPLRHPSRIKANLIADLNFNIFYLVYKPKSLLEKINAIMEILHPKKNPWSIGFYQKQIRPTLVKIGIKPTEG